MGTYIYSDVDRAVPPEMGPSGYINPLSSPTDGYMPNGVAIPLQDRANGGVAFPGSDSKRKMFQPGRNRQLSDQSDVEDAERNNYLTPTDPPLYSDSDFSSGGSPNDNVVVLSSSPPPIPGKHSDSVKMRASRFQRFDSGVGDCSSERGSASTDQMNKSMSSQSSSSYPRLSTHYEQHYEDIDQYNNDHHRRQRKNSSRKDQADSVIEPVRGSIDKMRPSTTTTHPFNGLRPLPRVDVAGVVHSESDDNLDAVRTTSMAEMVSSATENPPSMAGNNPIYPPHTYMPLGMESKNKQKPSSGRTCCFLVFFLIIIFAMSAAALSLSLYVFLRDEESVLQSPGRSTASHTSSAQAMLEELRQEINQLKAENALLKETVADYKDNFTSQFEPVQNELTDLQTLQQKMVTKYTTEFGKLQAEISNISLTPGPQGPAGVADFSLCNYSGSTTTGVSGNSISTGFHPSEAKLRDSFVIFAFCSYQGGLYAELDTQEVGNNMYQYKCNCTGDSKEDFTRCKINIWTCPRTHS